MKLLTKSDFILYRECPHNVWFKWHRPKEYAKLEPSEFEQSLAEMGNEVEKLARGMFQGGYLVEKRSEGAQELTKKLIEQKTPIIFQATFATDKYLVATDILKFNEKAGKYDLYEIKMSTTDSEVEFDKNGKPKKPNRKKEEQYENDLAFQANVVEMCGVKLNNKYLVRLNKQYVRYGELDFTPGKLFVIQDKTKIIDLLMQEVVFKMEAAYKVLNNPEIPKLEHPCYYGGRSSHCTAFDLIEKIPEYSVHYLNRIGNSKKLLRNLIEDNILEIKDVPEDYEGLVPKGKDSKPIKQNQVIAHKTQEPIIDIQGIKHELDSLNFPLYFIDYETYPTAIPPFDGYRPYQQIVFQYSLHVLRDKDSEPEHYEKIVLEGDPVREIVDSLKRDIGDKGTLISWNKSFENTRNKEMAQTLSDSESTQFMNNIINRTYDLEDIVKNQYYIHPGFRGRSSIKVVLPTIAKEMGLEEKLSYKNLGVKGGTDAVESYRQISEGELVGTDAEKKMKEMLEYCKLDTYAMYIIWKFLNDLVLNSE